MKGLLILSLFFLTFQSMAQKSDTLSRRNNLIKFNLSSHVLYKTSFIVSYERVLNDKKSLGITGGYLEFPGLSGSGSGFNVIKDENKNGFTFGAEYRIYLQKLNKYRAPRGIYIGPYFSYYHFYNDRNMSLSGDSSITYFNLKTKFNILNLGFQLGYQFIIKERLCIDFIFAGPSISSYSVNFNSDTNLSPDQENELAKAILSRLPLLDDIINDNKIHLNKTVVSWGPGYRYLFQIGYKF
jgi:hypothetical protein